MVLTFWDDPLIPVSVQTSCLLKVHVWKMFLNRKQTLLSFFTLCKTSSDNSISHVMLSLWLSWGHKEKSSSELILWEAWISSLHLICVTFPTTPPWLSRWFWCKLSLVDLFTEDIWHAPAELWLMMAELHLATLVSGAWLCACWVTVTLWVSPVLYLLWYNLTWVCCLLLYL